MRKHCLTLLLVALFSAAPACWAASLNARVDRTHLNNNETLAFTLAYDESTSEEPDTRALEQQFTILSKNQSSSISIVNGSATSTTTWYFELLPRKAGTLLIPSFNIEGNFSEAIPIEVKEGPRNAAQSAGSLYTETETDQQQVLVQQQVIVTWRLVTALNISEPKFQPPQIDGVLAQDLGNRIYQRAGADGNVERVIEQRYALFPQRSGKLVIPPQHFEVTVNTVRRSSWGLVHPGSTRVPANTEEHSIEVLPADNSHSGAWLPASNVEIWQELVGADTNKPATAGTAFTRVIHLRAVGLSAEQLPAPDMTADGIKVYSESPDFRNIAENNGITGVREDRAAIIATNPGQLVLPAVHIPWYDIQLKQWREAVLPEKVLQVMPGAAGAATQAATGKSPANTASAPDKTADDTNAASGARSQWSPWIIASGVLLVLWLLTLGWLWKIKRTPAAPETPPAPATVRAATNTNTLQEAARNSDWRELHRQLMDWRLADASRNALLADPAIAPAVKALENHLFNGGQAPDTALMQALPALLEKLSTTGNASPAASSQLEPLYRQ